MRSYATFVPSKPHQADTSAHEHGSWRSPNHRATTLLCRRPPSTWRAREARPPFLFADVNNAHSVITNLGLVALVRLLSLYKGGLRHATPITLPDAHPTQRQSVAAPTTTTTNGGPSNSCGAQHAPRFAFDSNFSFTPDACKD